MELTIGVIVVDHGSRRPESNQKLLEMAELFGRVTGREIVEPAHMELAEPTIGQAFDRCVQRGAGLVVVSPFFLLPGRHWLNDLPRLTAEAAARHPGVRYLVASPLGVDELMARLLDQRIEQCLRHATGDGDPCDLCRGTSACQLGGAQPEA